MPSSEWWYAILGAWLGFVFYGHYLYTKRPPREKQDDAGPVGVGGWLLLLVANLMYIGPVFAILKTLGALTTLEANPNVAALQIWVTYKTVYWWGLFIIVCLSHYGGLMLAISREPSVVTHAKIILWLVGPVGYIAMQLVLPASIFGMWQSDGTFEPNLLVSIVVATIWTAYLSRSKRVKATYGIPAAAQAIALRDQ